MFQDLNHKKDFWLWPQMENTQGIILWPFSHLASRDMWMGSNMCQRHTVIQTTLRGGLGHIWPHNICSVNVKAYWCVPDWNEGPPNQLAIAIAGKYTNIVRYCHCHCGILGLPIARLMNKGNASRWKQQLFSFFCHLHFCSFINFSSKVKHLYSGSSPKGAGGEAPHHLYKPFNKYKSS